jgi:hypothetical protein
LLRLTRGEAIVAGEDGSLLQPLIRVDLAVLVGVAEGAVELLDVALDPRELRAGGEDGDRSALRPDPAGQDAVDPVDLAAGGAVGAELLGDLLAGQRLADDVVGWDRAVTGAAVGRLAGEDEQLGVGRRGRDLGGAGLWRA